MIAIISDVHGNYPALKAVLCEIDKMGCEHIISLGDVSGYYCMVNECINEFRKRNIINLMGNHDYYILENIKCTRSYTVNKIIEWQRQIISEENWQYLSNSLIGIDNELISARHGGWNNPLEEYISDFCFENVEKYNVNFFCSGHTHIQMMEKLGRITYFNPGSVGQPRDGDPRAGYALFDGNSVKLFRTVYNIDEIAKEMEKNGFEKRVYDCLYYGTKIGSN